MGSEPTFWLPANAPASVLERNLDTEGTALVALHLTNCIVADPDELVRLATRCERLRSLMCVASRVKAADLLSLMLGSAQHLAHLELSMVGDDNAAVKQLEDVRRLTRGCSRDAVASSLRFLYVEVAGNANLDLLEAFLARCPNVTHFHVHLACGNFNSAVSLCARILANRPLMETIAFTSEVVLPEPRQPPAGRLEFRHCAAVCANVLCRREPHRWNIARLGDVATSAERGHLPEQLVVVAVNLPILEPQILEASSLNWRDVRSFCLVLLPREPFRMLDVGSVPRALAGPHCGAALLQLFQGFKRITELNLNSFHFDQGLDVTQLLDPLAGLQALSLPPCGLGHSGAIQRLALKCTNIEDLDIRSGADGESRVCSFCVQRLNLDRNDMAALSVSKGGRLTVNVPMVGSLLFSATCMLAELRIFDHAEYSLPDYRRLGEMLSNNDKLRALVLKYKELNFASPAFKADIIKVKQLRYLCILSEAILTYIAEPLLRWLASSMPTVQAIHAHYLDVGKEEMQVTWMCSIEDREELQGHAGATAEPHPLHRGHAIHGKPCVFCSTQTFIGLSKPHNRGRKTNL